MGRSIYILPLQVEALEIKLETFKNIEEDLSVLCSFSVCLNSVFNFMSSVLKTIKSSKTPIFYSNFMFSTFFL